MTGNKRRVAITGVSRGLGRAMVEKFVELGHVVAGCARTEEAIGQLQEQFGAPHRFDIVDVSDDKKVSTWCEDVWYSEPRVDLLINSAALINTNNLLWQVPPEEFGRLMDVNIKGIYHVLRHFIPKMLNQNEGMIVNFSSTWGRTVSPEVAPYCATKWAVEGLTRALSRELPQGLGAVALNPGIIDTDMLRSCFGESASCYPDAGEWAEIAVPFILALNEKQSGKELSVPVQI